jgi:hypothetical protein
VSRTTYVQVKMSDGTFELFEKGTEPAPAYADSGALWGDLNYRETKGPMGEDLSTRTKHREFMRAKGLTTADDFTGFWAQAQKQRDDFHRTGGDHRARRETIERAIYDAANRR